MTDNQASKEPDDAKLLRLVREAALQNQKDGHEPPADVLESCLLGHATPEQQEEFRCAMEASPGLRQRYLELLRELETVAGESEVTLSTDSADQVPIREQFLRNKGRALPGSRVPVRIIALAAVVIVAAVGSIWWLVGTPDRPHRGIAPVTWHLSEREVDPALLITDAPRGPKKGDSAAAFRSPQEAAMAAYSRILKFDGRGLVVDTSVHAGLMSERPEVEQWVVVMLAGEAGSVRLLQVGLPASGPPGPAGLESWSLGLPSRNLYTLTIRSDTTYTTWPGEQDTIMLLVVTAGDSIGFQAGRPHAVVR